MKETYLNNLSKELDLVHAKNKEEILKKFEKRYDFGLESGLSDEEIEKKLGDPSEVAKEYKEEFEESNNKDSEFKKNYNLIIHTINDSINIKKSSDNKIHIKFDFDDYDNYNITDNDKGVKIEYLKTKYFALNRKKSGEILVELPEDIMFDDAEIASTSGNINVEDLKSNKAIISSTSGIQNIEKIDSKVISLSSVNAQIKIEYIKAERVSISSVSGKIDAEDIDSNNIIIDTISGDINIENADGKLKTTSITGNILINDIKYKSLKGFVKGVFK